MDVPARIAHGGFVLTAHGSVLVAAFAIGCLLAVALVLLVPARPGRGDSPRPAEAAPDPAWRPAAPLA